MRLTKSLHHVEKEEEYTDPYGISLLRGVSKGKSFGESKPNLMHIDLLLQFATPDFVSPLRFCFALPPACEVIMAACTSESM